MSDEVWLTHVSDDRQLAVTVVRPGAALLLAKSCPDGWRVERMWCDQRGFCAFYVQAS